MGAPPVGEASRLSAASSRRFWQADLASKVELDQWQAGWAHSTRHLCQWSALAELAQAVEDPVLLAEAHAMVGDNKWAHLSRLLRMPALATRAQQDPARKLHEVGAALHSRVPVRTLHDLCDSVGRLTLAQWHSHPGATHGYREHLLQVAHQLVEASEAVGIVQAIEARGSGAPPKMDPVLDAWRERLPNPWDGMRAWDALLTWRHHVFMLVTARLEGPLMSNPEQLSSAHDAQWTVIRLARIARQLGQANTCVSTLLRLAKIQRMDVPDAAARDMEHGLVTLHQEHEESLLHPALGPQLLSVSVSGSPDAAARDALTAAPGDGVEASARYDAVARQMASGAKASAPSRRTHLLLAGLGLPGPLPEEAVRAQRRAGLSLVNGLDVREYLPQHRSDVLRLRAMLLRRSDEASGAHWLEASGLHAASVRTCPSNAKAWLSWGLFLEALLTTVLHQHGRQSNSLPSALVAAAKGSIEAGAKAAAGDATLALRRLEEAKAAGNDAATVAALEQQAAEAEQRSKDKVTAYVVGGQAVEAFLVAAMMGCPQPAMQLPRALWQLTHANAPVRQAFDRFASKLPAWMWLPWVPQLVSGLQRQEGGALARALSAVSQRYPGSSLLTIETYRSDMVVQYDRAYAAARALHEDHKAAQAHLEKANAAAAIAIRAVRLKHGLPEQPPAAAKPGAPSDAAGDAASVSKEAAVEAELQWAAEVVEAKSARQTAAHCHQKVTSAEMAMEACKSAHSRLKRTLEFIRSTHSSHMGELTAFAEAVKTRLGVNRESKLLPVVQAAMETCWHHRMISLAQIDSAAYQAGTAPDVAALDDQVPIFVQQQLGRNLASRCVPAAGFIVDSNSNSGASSSAVAAATASAEGDASSAAEATGVQVVKLENVAGLPASMRADLLRELCPVLPCEPDAASIEAVVVEGARPIDSLTRSLQRDPLPAQPDDRGRTGHWGRNPHFPATVSQLIPVLERWAERLRRRLGADPATDEAAPTRLTELSTYLSELRLGRMELPGQYAGFHPFNEPPGSQRTLRVTGVAPWVGSSLGPGQTPQRRLVLRGEDGRTAAFDVCSLDFSSVNSSVRTFQLHKCVSALMERHAAARARGLAVRAPLVVAVAHGLCLQEHQDTVVSLDRVMMETLVRSGEAGARSRLPLAWLEAARSAMARRPAASSSSTPPAARAAQAAQLAAFRAVCARGDLSDTALTRYVAARMPTPEAMMLLRDRLTHQLAPHATLSWALQLCSRVPSSTALDLSTGEVVAVDARVSITQRFELARPRIPFRLTRNMARFITPIGLDGPLPAGMAATASALMRRGQWLFAYAGLVLRDETIAAAAAHAQPKHVADACGPLAEPAIRSAAQASVGGILGRLDGLLPQRMALQLAAEGERHVRQLDARAGIKTPSRVQPGSPESKDPVTTLKEVLGAYKQPLGVAQIITPDEEYPPGPELPASYRSRVFGLIRAAMDERALCQMPLTWYAWM